jgi:PPOX class probable F420-dependent enzyme
MGVRLSEDELWEKVTSSHTGILTTLRKDGRPVPLPLWFAVVDRVIYVSTPAGSKKVARIRNDDRGTFLVESGRAWVELSAVILQGTLTEVTDEAERERVEDAINEKYRGFRVPMKKVPDATKKHYSAPSVMFRFDVTERPLTWDNAKLMNKPEASQA